MNDFKFDPDLVDNINALLFNLFEKISSPEQLYLETKNILLTYGIEIDSIDKFVLDPSDSDVYPQIGTLDNSPIYLYFAYSFDGGMFTNHVELVDNYSLKDILSYSISDLDADGEIFDSDDKDCDPFQINQDDVIEASLV
jgi:hypothetical protein